MISDKVEELVKGEVKRTFNPEFLNRLDEIILFLALSENDLIQILELMVNQLNQNLAQKAITVTVADDAKKWILNQTLTDRSYGARPLRRALQKYIEDPLSEALIQGTITTRPAFIEVFLEDNKLFYRPVDSRKSGRRAAVRKLACGGADGFVRPAERSSAGFSAVSVSWRLLFCAPFSTKPARNREPSPAATGCR